VQVPEKGTVTEQPDSLRFYQPVAVDPRLNDADAEKHSSSDTTLRISLLISLPSATPVRLTKIVSKSSSNLKPDLSGGDEDYDLPDLVVGTTEIVPVVPVVPASRTKAVAAPRDRTGTSKGDGKSSTPAATGSSDAPAKSEVEQVAQAEKEKGQKSGEESKERQWRLAKWVKNGTAWGIEGLPTLTEGASGTGSLT